MKYYKTKYLFYFMRLGKPVDLGSICHISKALGKENVPRGVKHVPFTS